METCIYFIPDFRLGYFFPPLLLQDWSFVIVYTNIVTTQIVPKVSTSPKVNRIRPWGLGFAAAAPKETAG